MRAHIRRAAHIAKRTKYFRSGNIPFNKIIMKKTNARPPANEMLDVIHHFMRLRSRFRHILPENLAAAKANLARAKGGLEPLSQGEHGLIYNLGALLSARQTPISMGDIARALDVPMSSATRMVDWLVCAGYAMRLPDPDDRRVVRIALTPIGQNIYTAAGDFMLGRVQKLMERFTPEEQKTLVRLLGRMAVALEEEQTRTSNS
jgi:DNA-binding MarR family transcriptional regulator